MEETQNNCIFCKIVAGEIPCHKVYEDETFLAFLDIHPKAKGHTLLIPKEHYPWFIDLPDNLGEQLFKNVTKLSRELKKTYSADYVRVGIVGTDIPHTHVHLIPLILDAPKSDDMNTV